MKHFVVFQMNPLVFLLLKLLWPATACINHKHRLNLCNRHQLLPRFHWSHALLAVGVVAISGAGTAVVFKNAVVPRLKSWIRKVVNEDAANKTDKKPTLAEEAAAAAAAKAAAAAAASDVARASQEMLASKTEEKKFYGELLSQLDVQVQEMKSMSNSIRKLEGQSNIQAREVQGRLLIQMAGQTTTHVQILVTATCIRRVEPSANPPHPKSYMEIMSMIQRGERPPNIRKLKPIQITGAN
ncbi:putative peroxisomal membrane protein [Helianthus annuus]|nr:putative peroxisomal membrane protein [Helianthus annuus]